MFISSPSYAHYRPASSFLEFRQNPRKTTRSSVEAPPEVGESGGNGGNPEAAPAPASSGQGVHKRAYWAGNFSVSVTESHAAVSFELEVEFAIADAAQPVVFDRLGRRRGSNRPDDPAITQVIQLLAACRIEAFAQHVFAPGANEFDTQPYLDVGSLNLLPDERNSMRAHRESHSATRGCGLHPNYQIDETSTRFR